MSDEIKHECGVALLRLRKDLNYYLRKYGTPYYGYHKLSLLLEKQHNRGQDGAGIASLGLDAEPGMPYYQLEKSNRDLSLADLLERIGTQIECGLNRRTLRSNNRDLIIEIVIPGTDSRRIAQRKRVAVPE